MADTNVLTPQLLKAYLEVEQQAWDETSDEDREFFYDRIWQGIYYWGCINRNEYLDGTPL